MLLKINDFKIKDIKLKKEISDAVFNYLVNNYELGISHKEILRVNVNIYFNVSWGKEHIVICSIRSGTKLISRLFYTRADGKEEFMVDKLFKKEKDNE